MAEFDLIRRFFSGLTTARADVRLGIGDDCALLAPGSQQLLMTLDTLVAGRHFLPDADPQALGHKALAVNLSDLAAMGADPAWAMLSLTMPKADELWLQGFSRGFGKLAEHFGVQLIGGDTCQGPLSISIQLTGHAPDSAVLRRSGAQPGDRIYVTGELGAAALALQQIQHGDHPGALRQALEQPWPRVEEGRALRRIASSCIDLSDGLSSDLGHICNASACGAVVELARLPLVQAVREYVMMNHDWHPVVSGGDDYELCFTVPPEQEARLLRLPLSCTCIGEIVPDGGLYFVDTDGSRYAVKPGYEHFS